MKQTQKIHPVTNVREYNILDPKIDKDSICKWTKKKKKKNQ